MAREKADPMENIVPDAYIVNLLLPDFVATECLSDLRVKIGIRPAALPSLPGNALARVDRPNPMSMNSIPSMRPTT